MYYYIKGTVVHKTDSIVVVDCNGVGYQMKASLSTISMIGEIGSQATIYTYLSVREDAMELYGFYSQEEKNMFLHLLSVSGVGPRMALSVLSVTIPAKLALAVITEDTKTITKAPGVGPKLAKRMILELKDKLSKEELTVSGSALEEEILPKGDCISEAISALVVLGYPAEEARRALHGADAAMSTEDLVKYSLKNLMN